MSVFWRRYNFKILSLCPLGWQRTFVPSLTRRLFSQGMKQKDWIFTFLLLGCSRALMAQCTADAGPDQAITCVDSFVVLMGNSNVSNAQYMWSGPNGFTSTQQQPIAWFPGVYSLTITDPGTGCTATDEMVVTEDTALPDVSATGGFLSCSSTLVLSGVSNTPGVAFLWSGPGGFSSTLQNPTISTAGVYTLCVFSPVNGCSACDTAVVEQPPVISLLPNLSPIRCFGGSDGAITVTAVGGVPPLSFQWSTGATGPTIANLSAGVYTVTVTDAEGCSSSQTFVLTQPDSILISSVWISPVACFGKADGSIFLGSLTGGTPPYLFSWSGPNGFNATTQSIQSLAAGEYVLTITDSQGCTSVHEFVVGGPIMPLEVTRVLICDEQATLSVRGGTGPYWAEWERLDTSWIYYGLTIYQPAVGLYEVRVYDTMGCSLTLKVNVPADAPPCTRIAGRVVYDKDKNCQADPAETGLFAWMVTAQGAHDTFYGITDAQGYYVMLVSPDIYTVRLIPPNSQDIVCQNDVLVQLNQAGDAAVVNFEAQVADPPCPRLTVDLSTPFLRRCFTGLYSVRYCNQGVEPIPQVRVELELDPFLTFSDATVAAIPLGNNTFQFNLGTVPPGFCGQFWVSVQVSCQAALGQIHCSKARILPDTLCEPPHPLWSGAHVQVRSQCTGDSLLFLLHNIGPQPMSVPLEYIVIEDGIMLRQGSAAPLAAGETMPVAVPANGATWRLEAIQEPYTPRNDRPVLSVEGCTTTGSFTTGFAAQFPTGENRPQEDVDCTDNVGSYDPNDKQAFPIGYGPAHYVRPGTEIEYLIRFQNTGTDTAFTVVVRDTLSPWLDPLTVRPGSSSHPYRFDLMGPSVLLFEFQNILLPDSNTNEAASHGYVKFRIRPRTNTPLETDIFNSAAIYFDFNEPVMTNTTRHRIGQNFLSVSSWVPVQPQLKVSVVPNPLTHSAWLALDAAPATGRYTLRLWDATGRLAREASADAPQFLLQAENLPPGTYAFSISREGVPVGSGKLVVVQR